MKWTEEELREIAEFDAMVDETCEVDLAFSAELDMVARDQAADPDVRRRREWVRAWRKAHPEKCALYNKRWREKWNENADSINAARRERYATDEEFRRRCLNAVKDTRARLGTETATEQSRRYRKGVYADPDRYQRYKERNREWNKRYRTKRKNNPEAMDKIRKQKRNYYKKVMADPERAAAYKAKAHEAYLRRKERLKEASDG